jgi:hypothetical protein
MIGAQSANNEFLILFDLFDDTWSSPFKLHRPEPGLRRIGHGRGQGPERGAKVALSQATMTFIVSKCATGSKNSDSNNCIYIEQ